MRLYQIVLYQIYNILYYIIIYIYIHTLRSGPNRPIRQWQGFDLSGTLLPYLSLCRGLNFDCGLRLRILGLFADSVVPDTKNTWEGFCSGPKHCYSGVSSQLWLAQVWLILFLHLDTFCLACNNSFDYFPQFIPTLEILWTGPQLSALS